ncbi:MAG: PGF-pre-PGF domain-containing protein [Candidatus Aenigmarchaeota archaeon]|nr:PGF-pre-PGF domain-containing protein [Candidatus Aenigmarchaeota archaeon]
MDKKISALFLLTTLFGILLSFNYVAAPTCFDHNGNQANCGSAAGCVWSPADTDPFCDDPVGCCINGGFTGGCWSLDGNQVGCEADASCQWKPNDKNQNPWCWNNAGCCEKKGCWNFDGTNETNCESQLSGLCDWQTGFFCPNPLGCCSQKYCTQITTEAGCDLAQSSFGMPCEWSGSTCQDQGFTAFNDDDSCLEVGGQWNSTSQMCSFTGSDSGGGGGGFFTGGFNAGFFQACWFADNSPTICGNVTGCVYCNSTFVAQDGHFCENKQIGWCEGHDPSAAGFEAQGFANDTMECTDIRLERTCNCGPLQNCKWNGTACTTGVLTQSEKTTCQPPVSFCDDAQNQTACSQLKDLYFMPCNWNSNENECQFDMGSVFESGTTGNFFDIKDSDSCIAGGGTWKEETYIENGITQNEGWCEFGFGVGYEDCDDACWACEHDENGNQWPNGTAAQQACENSELGYCNFQSDPFSFNGYGWCNYAQDFYYGGGSCDNDCKSCSFMNDPETKCGENANCKWVTDVLNPEIGWCDDINKKTCSDSCFNCYDPSSCAASDSTCQWDNSNFFCKPEGFTGEICFDGTDNDNDGNTDCSDGDCTFDQFCGGASFGSCQQYSNNQTLCTATSTPLGNCIWVETEWGEEFCGMPGENCWTFDAQVGCQGATGCAWKNVTQLGGQPFCEINKTREEPCFSLFNQTSCAANPLCTWTVEQGFGGFIQQFCESKIFGNCVVHDDNETACGENPTCVWIEDEFSPDGGWCDPICFSRDITNAECSANANCTLQETHCEPTIIMGDCPNRDGNKTACDAAFTCQWFPDPNGPGVGINQGWCNDKGTMKMFEKIDPSPPAMLGDDQCPESGKEEEVDICGYGMKDMGDAYGFGLGVVSFRDSAICNGMFTQSGVTGTGRNTTKMNVFLDTDGVNTNGCNVTDDLGNTHLGFEFRLRYVGEWADSELKETRSFSLCSNQTWVQTNIAATGFRQLMCGEINGPMIAVDKEDLGKFSTLYNKTKTMRVFGTMADAVHNLTVPSDAVGPSFYTPGSVDFKFECCTCPGADLDDDGITSDKDPDCKFVKQFGYVPTEDCINDKDDDGDGAVDCDDVQCDPKPECGGTMNFLADADDNTSPKMTYTQIDVYTDGAFLVFNTDEPANGTVQFFKSDSTCSNTTSANGYRALNDLGMPGYTFDDYKPFHAAAADNFEGNPNALGYNLANATSYFYKLRVCDPSNNCAVSACSNFTTDDFENDFLFKMEVDEGFSVDIPDLGMDNSDFSTATKTNATTGKSINITVNCPATGYNITFVGADLMKAKTLELENAFTCDSTNKLLGVNSTKWQKMLYDLGVDSVVLTFGTTASKIEKCDDQGSNCVDVSSYATCVFGASSTTCTIPISLGFSTYKVSSTSATTTTVASTSSSGGGGGGGGATAKAVAVRKVSTVFSEVSPDKVNKWTVTTKGVGLVEMHLEVKNKANTVRMTVERLDNKPVSITRETTGKVYQYMEITKTGLTDDNLNMAKLKFAVNKSWLTANNVDPMKVVLNRYADGEWQKLKTTILSAVNDTYEYEAESPGLSTFVITSDETAATTTTLMSLPTTTVMPVVTTSTTVRRTIPTLPEIKLPESLPKPQLTVSQMKWMIAIGAVLIIVGLIIWRLVAMNTAEVPKKKK